MYSTLKPCFGCLKELLQAKVRAVRYLHEWPQEDPALRAEYLRLLKELPDGVRRVEGMEDPDEEWASGREIAADNGHSPPGEEGIVGQVS